MSEHFFITGGLGCIGAWVIRNLIQSGTAVLQVVFLQLKVAQS